MGISFAIPINLAINAAEQIRKTGKVQRSMLSVEIGPIDALKAQGLGLPDSRGALVNNIPPHSPAAKAGIEVGDVIRSVNGKVISSFSDLPPLIGMMPPGTKPPWVLSVTANRLEIDRHSFGTQSGCNSQRR